MPQTITKRSEPCTTCGGVVITIERQPAAGRLKPTSLRKSTAWSCHAEHASPADGIDADCGHHH
jgi:hypothetical protein